MSLDYHSETYPLTFSLGLGEGCIASIFFDGSSIASGTKLDITIYAPSTISQINYIGFDDEDDEFHAFANTDFKYSGDRITINTTVANTNISSISMSIEFDTSSGNMQGAYGINAITLTNGKIVGSSGNWPLISSVSKVISKTDSINKPLPNYGTLILANFRDTGGVGDVGNLSQTITTKVGSEYSFPRRGKNSMEYGIYPLYNAINNSSGLGPTMPTGGPAPGVNNWKPTYSSVDFNPYTGSAVIDVSSQDTSIQLTYQADYSGNSWRDGMLVSFFLKVSDSYSGVFSTNPPIKSLGINIDCRNFTTTENTDAGITSFTVPDVSSGTNVYWGYGDWVEFVFRIKNPLATLPSPSIAYVSFNITLTDSGVFKYFSDPGIYPANGVDKVYPGFFVPTVG